MKTNISHSTSYVSLAVLTVVTALPLSLALFGAPSDALVLSGDLSAVRKQAAEERAEQRAVRRQYFEFRERCQERMARDPDFVCPAIYDEEGIEQFLHGAASEDEVVTDETDVDVKEYDLHDLRRAQRTGICPEHFREMRGFYELCLRLSGERTYDERAERIMNRLLKQRDERTGEVEEARLNDLFPGFEGVRPDR